MSDRELVCAVPQTLPLTVTPPSYPEPQLTDDDCAVVIDVEDLRHLVTMASATGGWNEFEDDALDKARSMLADIDARYDTAPLQVIRAVTDTEAGELPVVRDLNEYAPGAAADAGARGQTFAAGGSSQPAAEVPHRKEMP